MIWRLTYCNKKGVEARVDIIKGDTTSVEIMEGSANPFTISYRLDKNDKSGHIMTSSADVEIFETETFNIDDLKTSNETELKVEYFEDNVLTWSGFILPDFFSREIGSPNIVRMTASDRLTALKGITLSDLPAKVSLRDLIELCLEQTGLSLALVAQIQINQGSTNILDSEVLSQRLTDVRGRSISCYDILMAIMVATNSTIRQRKGQWQVYNKLEHEQRTPNIFFDKVERGAIRTIQPVASSVGVYQEFGGGRSHPDNYDFAQGLSGWSTVGGFNAAIGDKLIKEFTAGSSGGATISIVPDNNVTIKPYLINNNEYIRNINPKYIESANIDIPYTGYGVININVDVNAIGPAIAHPSRPSAFMRIAVVAIKGTTVKTLDHGGAFIDMPSENPPVFAKEFERGTDFTNIRAVTSGMIVNGKLEIPEGDSFSNWKIRVRVYGGGGGYDVAFNSIMVKLSLDATDSPKGNIFKTTQGSNYTKLHDVETTIFGDYITSGLNGYFYNYPIDDTSNLYLPNGDLSSPTWITIFDTTERPLLHHISRQKSRLFSVAHDILRANIDVESFDPLAVFQDCNGGKYVVVSASFDFLRSEADVELEQIAYDNTILKRDFIYSYFGDGESGIKSIGGISGGTGTGGTGGGMTSEQLEMLTNLASWWKLDEENDAIYSEKSVYSLKELSAYGVGSGTGGGGGTGYDRLDAWSDYTSDKAGWVLSALLGNDLNTRVSNIEANSALNISLTGAGNAITSVSKSGNLLTFNKGLEFSLSTHNHDTIYKPIGYVPSWSEITDKPSTFAPSAHTHTIDQITGLQGALDLKAPLANPTFTGNVTAPTFIGALSVSPPEGALGLRTLSVGGYGVRWQYRPSTLEAIKTGIGFGWYDTEWVIGNIRGGGQNSYGFGIGYRSDSANEITGAFRIATNGTAYLNNVQIATVNSNVASATKLQTARTIAGVSFDGTADIAIPFANLSSKPTTLGGYGITDAVTTNTTQTVSGAKTFSAALTASVSVTTPKVIFAAGGWSLEQSGTELQMKYNGVVKQRMLSDGSIVATGELTAYVAAT